MVASRACGKGRDSSQGRTSDEGLSLGGAPSSHRNGAEQKTQSSLSLPRHLVVEQVPPPPYNGKEERGPYPSRPGPAFPLVVGAVCRDPVRRTGFENLLRMNLNV